MGGRGTELGERAYGDEIAVAPGQGVTAAEDRAHSVHEPADVLAHPDAVLFLFFSDVFCGVSLIRVRAMRVLYMVCGVGLTSWDLATWEWDAI